jgi:SAM-dependent methyltransferase/AcrR family transcriptional regulator
MVSEMMTTRQPSTRLAGKELTRQALSRAALELLADNSFDSLSLREVTRVAGITPTAFYRHYEDMEELGLVLVEESFASLGAMLKDARAQTSFDEGAIERSLAVVVRHLHDRTAHFRFIARERYGGVRRLRRAINREVQLFADALAIDLIAAPGVDGWTAQDRRMLAGVITETVIGLVAELLGVPAWGEPSATSTLAGDRGPLTGRGFAGARRAASAPQSGMAGNRSGEGDGLAANRWVEGDAPRGAMYDRRFEELAARGMDVHDEAALIDSFGVGSVLDAGCGTGRVAIELSRRGHDVVGVDVDPRMLEEARRKAPALPWHEGDLADPDLAFDRLFDTVVMAGNVLIFVAPDTEGQVLFNMARHLAPGGRLIAGYSLHPDRLSVARHDEFAAGVGLELAHRWSTWDRQPFDPTVDSYAVSVHRRPL